MINFEEALKIARKRAKEDGVTLVSTTDDDSAWYFGNETQNYFAQFGSGPIVVDKTTGKTWYASTTELIRNGSGLKFKDI